MNSNQQYQQSNCGECSLCCKLLKIEAEPEAIPEFKFKDWNTWCPHALKQKARLGGCGRYESRPQACRTFECVWIQSQHRQDVPSLPLALKPNNCHVVMAGSFEDSMVMFAYVDPTHPNAWRQDPLRQHLINVSNLGVTVVIVSRQRRYIMTRDSPTIELKESELEELVGEKLFKRTKKEGIQWAWKKE